MMSNIHFMYIIGIIISSYILYFDFDQNYGKLRNGFAVLLLSFIWLISLPVLYFKHKKYSL